MIAKGNHFDSELDRIANEAARVFARLFANSKDASVLLKGLDDLRELLDCMALGTAEHGLAALRIRNARRFVESMELGAAKYELRILKGGLKHQLKTSGKSPFEAPHHQLNDSVFIQVT